jgi:tetratricopeptide (TPR) repeat protein
LLSAWQDGAKEWRESEARQLAGFTPLTDAWKKYEPVTYSIDTITLTLPADAAVTKAYAEEVTKFIKQEIATREIALQADITKDGGKPETVNKLGVLYAKYGLNDQAEKEFDRILKTTEFVPALLNIGNLSFLKGDAKKALEYYERAEKKEPGKATVLLCIARANHELENYGKVKEAYDKLKTADSSLAAQFAYLDLRGTEATRAADVGGVKGTVVWDEK